MQHTFKIVDKNKIKLTLISCFLLVFCISCNNKIKDFNVENLIGTWYTGDSDTYTEWEFTNDHLYTIKGSNWAVVSLGIDSRFNINGDTLLLDIYPRPYNEFIILNYTNTSLAISYLGQIIQLQKIENINLSFSKAIAFNDLPHLCQFQNEKFNRRIEYFNNKSDSEYLVEMEKLSKMLTQIQFCNDTDTNIFPILYRKPLR